MKFTVVQSSNFVHRNSSFIIHTPPELRFCSRAREKNYFVLRTSPFAFSFNAFRGSFPYGGETFSAVSIPIPEFRDSFADLREGFPAFGETFTAFRDSFTALRETSTAGGESSTALRESFPEGQKSLTDFWGNDA